MTRKLLLGLIGAGIQRSMAPILHEEEARQHGLRVHYQLIDLDAAGLGVEALPELVRAARAMGFAGLNITYPCKQAVIPLLDGLSDEARSIGAVNTVVREDQRFIGHNTDGSGWSWGLKRALPGADLSFVVLLGAGGAGSACADAVLRLGAKKLSVFDQDAARAAALARRLNDAFGAARAEAGSDLPAAMKQATGFINATPMGMERSPGMPLGEDLLRPGLWVSDAVYVPLDTALLQAARRRGCATVDGGHMNVGQAVRAFKLFTGEEADAERMELHFRSMSLPT
ncbi:MAG TPA: shikimate dehydrogenase [Burkholderiales bacterium]|nr:shikimate dehydrogenase [Burkholderiales bacterium]